MLSFSKLVVTCSVLAASGIPNLSDTLKDLWSSASGSPDLSDKLRDLWSSSKESLVIEPCEKWVAQKGELSMREKRDAIPKIKSDLCTKNALSGLFSGAIPIPGVDIGTGAVAGFYLQARGACMVAALRGYDVRDNATQEMILWALAGETVSEGLKRVATVAATRGSQTLVESALKKLPSKALRQVSKKLWPVLGQHLISKGPNGLLALVDTHCRTSNGRCCWGNCWLVFLPSSNWLCGETRLWHDRQRGGGASQLARWWKLW